MELAIALASISQPVFVVNLNQTYTALRGLLSAGLSFQGPFEGAIHCAI